MLSDRKLCTVHCNSTAWWLCWAPERPHLTHGVLLTAEMDEMEYGDGGEDGGADLADLPAMDEEPFLDAVADITTEDADIVDAGAPQSDVPLTDAPTEDLDPTQLAEVTEMYNPLIQQPAEADASPAAAAAITTGAPADTVSVPVSTADPEASTLTPTPAVSTAPPTSPPAVAAEPVVPSPARVTVPSPAPPVQAAMPLSERRAVSFAEPLVQEPAAEDAVPAGVEANGGQVSDGLPAAEEAVMGEAEVEDDEYVAETEDDEYGDLEVYVEDAEEGEKISGASQTGTAEDDNVGRSPTAPAVAYETEGEIPLPVEGNPLPPPPSKFDTFDVHVPQMSSSGKTVRILLARCKFAAMHTISVPDGLELEA